MSRIIVISNRVLDPKKAAQAGGVAVALTDVIARTKGKWIGWDGKTVPDQTAIAATTNPRRRSSVITTSLTEEEHRGYYLGYSNSVLWPVFHNRLDLAQFEAGYYNTYQQVNERFANLVASLIQPNDLVWVHDYQFIPLGLELRKLGVENPIGFFLHIPFPPAQSFLAIPEHRELAGAFSAYDLIGLQTCADVANMLVYMQQGVRAQILSDGRLRAFDRLLSVESFPIGIDPDDFARPRGALPLVQGRRIAKRIIGIDRLDYSKGLPQKFRAFGRFLDISPQYRRKVVLTQIASPTRESVHAYADIRKELESLSGSINGRFGELDWVPIHYIHRSVPRSKLPEIYGSSQIGIVTPLRDGMNLVAKEYVAAQDITDPGVLILSQFAGAAEELKDAVIVNPYNIEETAKAILVATEMPLDERVERQLRLVEAVRSNDVNAWSDGFIAALEKQARKANQPLSDQHAERVKGALAKLDQIALSGAQGAAGPAKRKGEVAA